MVPPMKAESYPIMTAQKAALKAGSVRLWLEGEIRGCLTLLRRHRRDSCRRMVALADLEISELLVE